MSTPWVVFNCACWFVTGWSCHSIRVNLRRIREIDAEMRARG